MKALTVHPIYAMMIAENAKTVECRSWKTNYRGDILICSSAKKEPGTIPGHALCVCELYDIVDFTSEHLDAAYMDEIPDKKSYAWLLRNCRLIIPVPVKGKQSLWEYDGKIEYAPDFLAKARDWYNQYYTPLFV